MNAAEYEAKEVSVTEIEPIGFGEGGISYKAQLESGELLPEVDARAAELIQSGEMMHRVTDQDDGCIDGRPAVELLFMSEDKNFYTRPIDDAAEHERAKVAGGGFVTALAMARALDLPAESVEDDIMRVSAKLAESGVYCGAHTGAHSHDEVTDCGANDKIDQILENGVKYRNEIGSVSAALLGVAGVEYNDSIQGDVFDGWSRALAHDVYFEGSTGASRFTAIEESLRSNQAATGDYLKPVGVSKNLAGDHKEDYIVINYQEGMTFSQPTFRKQLAEEFPELPDERLAQAFVVDVPRIVTLAKALTKDGTDQSFKKALYAGVAYQVATAATLTDGTLRTFIVQ